MGTGKSYSSHTALITLIKQSECMNLTKAFNYVNHEVFLAELYL